MNKILVSFLLLALSISAFSQQTTTPQKISTADYLKKRKNQKTAAWVCLGGGNVLFPTGYAILPKNYNLILGDPEKDDQAFLGGALLLIGSSAMLTSIPLSLASNRNKKKGMGLSFKNKSIPKLHQGSFISQAVPSLTLKINL